ncbi:MAG TPA: SH3 domain-containing protein, partial [Oceanobacillus sp.]|nr:SH3 domain-containing protein [Oceanobacillus sp.]
MHLRKYHFLALFLTAFLVIYASYSTQAQTSHIIQIQPTSGPAGTTVTIQDVSGTNGGKPCSVSGPSGTQNIGVIQRGLLSYTIPADAAAGAVFSFSCQGSAPASATNTVSFTVILLLVIVSPEPVDTDGDGTVDNGDQCPNQAGPRENRGCPVEQAPVDSDGDGIADNVDACPNQAGVPEANGCVPAPQLPSLPADGACVLATLEAGSVNIREGTSTDTAVVGQLDPMQIYSVIGRNADSSWLQVNGGWVAAFVVRLGGDCSTLPQTDGVAVPDLVLEQPQDPVGLLLPAIQKVRDAAARMENCPEYMPAVDALPTFLALYIVGDPDPCAAAAAEMDNLFFNPGGQAAPSVPSDSCPEGFPGANAMIPVFNNLLHNTPPETQAYLTSLADISVSPSLFCTLLMDLSGGFLTEFTFPEVEHVLPVAYVWCDAEGSRQESLALKLQAIAIAPEYLRNLDGDCALFDDLHVLGSVPPGNVQFFTMLIQNCAVSAAEAGHRAFSDAVRGAFDAAAAANQGCAGFQVLPNYPLPPDLQPLLPQIAAQDAICTGNFRILATHNPQLGAETLYRILKSVDPCGAAYAFAYDGDIPMNVVQPPDCIQGNQLVLQGAAQGNQVVIDASSSWFQKITALDRPLDEICTLPAQLGVGGDFAVIPTATMGAFAANPTATLPIFVALPTATLPQFAANPTEEVLPEGAFPEDDQGEQPPPEGEEPPPAEEPEAPAEPAGEGEPAAQEQPPALDGQNIPPVPSG